MKKSKFQESLFFSPLAKVGHFVKEREREREREERGEREKYGKPITI